MVRDAKKPVPWPQGLEPSPELHTAGQLPLTSFPDCSHKDQTTSPKAPGWPALPPLGSHLPLPLASRVSSQTSFPTQGPGACWALCMGGLPPPFPVWPFPTLQGPTVCTPSSKGPLVLGVPLKRRARPMPILLPPQGLAQSLRWFSNCLLQNNKALIRWQHITAKGD